MSWNVNAFGFILAFPLLRNGSRNCTKDCRRRGRWHGPGAGERARFWRLRRSQQADAVERPVPQERDADEVLFAERRRNTANRPSSRDCRPSPRCTPRARYRESRPRRRAPAPTRGSSTPGHSLIERDAVHVHDAVDHIDRLAALRDDALDKNVVLGVGNRVAEHNDIPRCHAARSPCGR